MHGFQSTRPRGARPEWGPSSRPRGSCFNPRARVGRDSSMESMPRFAFRFQSTRPRGARQRHERGRDERAGVSIHAPAWGATEVTPCVSYRLDCFNPRARVGRDRAIATSALQLPVFQSTRPRGARRARRSPGRRVHTCFNPRARVGRDLIVTAAGATAPEFQSTRPRGARLVRTERTPEGCRVSIHAPAWGATRQR